MHEAGVVQQRGRLEARDMATKLRRGLVGSQNRCDSVPPNERTDPVLDRPVTRMTLLFSGRNRVQIRRRCRERDRSALPPRFVDQLLKQEPRAIRTLEG